MFCVPKSGPCARRDSALTQADILFCAMPIAFFLSVVSLL